MSTTEIRYQKNGKETILKGWMADCFLYFYRKSKLYGNHYKISGFDSFIIKGKNFKTRRYKMYQSFEIAQNTSFSLEDCSFEVLDQLIVKGEDISLKNISNNKYYMRVCVEDNKKTDISLEASPNPIGYFIKSQEGQVRLNGDGSTCYFQMVGVQDLHITDASNIDLETLKRKIENIDIVRSNVNVWDFKDAKVNLQDSKVHVSQISKENKFTLKQSKLLIDNAYFMENKQSAIIYDKNGILYVNDDSNPMTKICLISVLKALQNKLETQLAFKQESILKEQKNLQEQEEQIEILKKELQNNLDKTNENIRLSLIRQKIKEIE